MNEHYKLSFSDNFFDLFDTRRWDGCVFREYREENYFYEDEDDLIFEFPLPGFSKEEVKVQTDYDKFYISWGNENDGGSYESLIPDDFSPAPEAKMENGIFTWKFYKIEEERDNIPVL